MIETERQDLSNNIVRVRFQTQQAGEMAARCASSGLENLSGHVYQVEFTECGIALDCSELWLDEKHE
jgi:hypothetical protein